MTENEYLQLAEDFKNVVAKKDDQIRDLIKTIFTLYGLTRAGDDYADPDIYGTARAIASDAVSKIMKWDDDEEPF